MPQILLLKYYIGHFAHLTSLRYVGKISEKILAPLDQILDPLLNMLLKITKRAQKYIDK